MKKITYPGESHVNSLAGRRNFLKSAATFAGGIAGFSLLSSSAMAGNLIGDKSTDKDSNIIGPKEGYSPQVGTLVSMMAWLRPQVIGSVKSMTTEQLDFLLDDKANTIGALLYHLAATDAFYHEHTFKGIT